jgi:hypothetical protein
MLINVDPQMSAPFHGLCIDMKGHVLSWGLSGAMLHRNRESKNDRPRLTPCVANIRT